MKVVSSHTHRPTVLAVSHCTSIIRQIDFSPDGRCVRLSIALFDICMCVCVCVCVCVYIHAFAFLFSE